MNRNIIIAILAIIIIAVAGGIAFAQTSAAADGNKQNTQINFLSNSHLKNGEMVQFELKDSQGKAIADQRINITFEDNGQKQNFSIKTDNNNQTITIEQGTTSETEKVSGNSTASTVKYNEKTTSSNSSSGSSLSEGPGPNLYYDEEFNVWYDDNGIIRGGQSDGKSMWDLVNNQPIVTENGLE